MSRQIDINQLLEEIGTSSRSAVDPWTLSRRSSEPIRGNGLEPGVLGDLGSPVQELASAVQTAVSIAQGNRLESRAASGSAEGSGTPGSGLFTGLLKLFPLASGIAKIFGFGESATAAAPVEYAIPPSISFEGALATLGNQTSSLSYGSDGLPRLAESAAEHLRNVGTGSAFTDARAKMLETLVKQPSGTGIEGPSGSFEPLLPSGTMQTGGDYPRPLRSTSNDLGTQTNSAMLSANPDKQSSGTQPGQSILVQVQAMDSQSFMDHSQQIAQAVRQAMLNLNSLNDVITDL